MAEPKHHSNEKTGSEMRLEKKQVFYLYTQKKGLNIQEHYKILRYEVIIFEFLDTGKQIRR